MAENPFKKTLSKQDLTKTGSQESSANKLVHKGSLGNLKNSSELSQKFGRSRKVEFRIARGDVFDDTIEKVVGTYYNAYSNSASPYEINNNDIEEYSNQNLQTSLTEENLSSSESYPSLQYLSKAYWEIYSYSPYPYLNDEGKKKTFKTSKNILINFLKNRIKCLCK